MHKFLLFFFIFITVLNDETTEASKLVTGFDHNSTNMGWRVVNDSVMGGRSRGNLEITDEKLVFTGSTNTNGGGFSSIRSKRLRLNFGDHEKLRIKLRGDGREYTFRVNSSRTPVSYWSKFQTTANQWEEIELPFSSFWPNWRGRKLNQPAISPSEITALGIMIYDGQDGPFRLEVDWIKVD